jgi:hypothetical protein
MLNAASDDAGGGGVDDAHDDGADLCAQAAVGSGAAEKEGGNEDEDEAPPMAEEEEEEEANVDEAEADADGHVDAGDELDMVLSRTERAASASSNVSSASRCGVTTPCGNAALSTVDAKA